MVKLCFYLISQKKKKATTLTMWLSMIEWSTIKFIKDFSSLKKNILKSLIFLPAPVRKFSSALSYSRIHGWGRGSHSYYGKGFPLILQGGVPTHITGRGSHSNYGLPLLLLIHNMGVFIDTARGHSLLMRSFIHLFILS